MNSTMWESKGSDGHHLQYSYQGLYRNFVDITYLNFVIGRVPETTEFLDLHGNGIKDIRAIGGLDQLPKLRALGLRDNNIERVDRGAQLF